MTTYTESQWEAILKEKDDIIESKDKEIVRLQSLLSAYKLILEDDGK
jgi:hypothetical protein